MGAYFGQRIREHREARGLKSADVAKGIGLQPTNYSAIENGRRDPQEEHLQGLAAMAALGLTYDEVKTWADLDRLGEAGLKRLKTYAGELLDSINVESGHVTADWFGAVPYPPTETELAIINRAKDAGVSFPPLSEPTFWATPPEQRRKSLLLLECIVEETSQYAPKSKTLLKDQPDLLPR